MDNVSLEITASPDPWILGGRNTIIVAASNDQVINVHVVATFQSGLTLEGDLAVTVKDALTGLQATADSGSLTPDPSTPDTFDWTP